MQCIWCVVSIAPSVPRMRTWGWFGSEAAAEEYVMSSGRFLAEGRYYTHVVIEQVPAGVIWTDRKEQWFELRDEVARRCERPPELDRVSHFALG